jgi:hypothetical protein
VGGGEGLVSGRNEDNSTEEGMYAIVLARESVFGNNFGLCSSNSLPSAAMSASDEGMEDS